MGLGLGLLIDGTRIRTVAVFFITYAVLFSAIELIGLHRGVLHSGGDNLSK